MDEAAPDTGTPAGGEQPEEELTLLSLAPLAPGVAQGVRRFNEVRQGYIDALARIFQVPAELIYPSRPPRVDPAPEDAL